ncbi:hypothetical protein GCM10010435_37970 [Winogradskya consettensis]|uniref:Glycosyltransferase RgtA/B/C/D-like domain-containing protein n=1 Tax=Winogradskya consettensis TaxID=113560 RepID=A0A919VYW4_9ACTN|nr:hypothetical protein [Actinoplanes consettensis]GIM83765.1 hypothetical protein Aco04nite_88120 [Actinoplanes consettensis]
MIRFFSSGWSVVIAACVAVLVRVPFLFTGLSTDEGGYAYVAQRWARGDRLYDTAWLDRPQGLLLTYRALLAIGDGGWAIRLGMVAGGAIITVAVAVIARLLIGRAAGVWAAWIYAIVGVAPHLEGMTFNGELLAGIPSTVAIACAVYWWRPDPAFSSAAASASSAGSADPPVSATATAETSAAATATSTAAASTAATAASTAETSARAARGARPSRALRRSMWWLAGAGVLAGVALTMKQSGIDGIVVGALIVVLARNWRAAGVFAATAAVPLVASVVHGISVGWNYYWTALIGYQLSAMGGDGSNTSTRLSDLGRHAGDIALDLTVIVLLSVFGWRLLDRGGRWVLGAWLFAGFVGINLGGSYWPHYFVQPLPALVVLVAAMLIGIPAALPRRALAAVVVLPTLVWLVALIPMSPARRADTVPYDALAARDDRIAAVIRASTTPGQRIYVLESEAYLYFAADRQASYPYLWGKPIDKIPDALPRLRAMLSSAQRPTLVLLDTPPAAVDPSGGIAADLAMYYHPETVVEGVPILRANP